VVFWTNGYAFLRLRRQSNNIAAAPTAKTMTIFHQEKSFHIHSEAHIQLPSLFKKLKNRSPSDRKTGFRQDIFPPEE